MCTSSVWVVSSSVSAVVFSFSVVVSEVFDVSYSGGVQGINVVSSDSAVVSLVSSATLPLSLLPF